MTTTRPNTITIQFDRGAKIWDLVDTVEGMALGKVYLDPGIDNGGEPFLIAMDGFVVGVIPCEVTDGAPVAMLLTPAVVQAAGTRKPKELTPTIEVDLTANRAVVAVGQGHEFTGPVDFEHADEYPKWRRLIPATTQRLPPSLAFSPELVKKVAGAIGLGDNIPIVFGGGEKTTGILIGSQSSLFERTSFGLIVPMPVDVDTIESYVQDVLDLRDPIMGDPQDLRDESIKEFAARYELAERGILSGPMWMGRISTNHPTAHMLSDVQQVRTAGDADPFVFLCGPTSMTAEPVLMDQIDNICGNCLSAWKRKYEMEEGGAP